MFLLWRIKQILMMQSDDYEVQGNVKGLKDFEIRKKVTAEQAISS